MNPFRFIKRRKHGRSMPAPRLVVRDRPAPIPPEVAQDAPIPSDMRSVGDSLPQTREAVSELQDDDGRE